MRLASRFARLTLWSPVPRTMAAKTLYFPVLTSQELYATRQVTGVFGVDDFGGD